MKHFDSATCSNCQTLFDCLPIEGDEDGNYYVILESKPCSTCGQMLCPCCEQSVCEHGETHCIEHVTVLEADSKYPLKCCPACLAEARAQELAPAAMCPDCGSLELVGELADHGVDRDTGYHDAQELFRCLTCGARGLAEEAELKPALRIEPMRENSKASTAQPGAA